MNPHTDMHYSLIVMTYTLCQALEADRFLHYDVR